jgi:uncharacterized protein (TIGR02246 family)
MPWSPARSLSLLLACGAACATVDRDHDTGALTRALQRYVAAARSIDPEAIASFYTPAGTLFEPGIQPIVGRDAIRAFIASFPGVRVEIATATPETIDVHGDVAYVWGAFFEKLDFPGQPVSAQQGKFVAQWARQPDGAWLIERMYRIPLPEPQ